MLARRDVLIGLGLAGLWPSFASARIEAVEAGSVIDLRGVATALLAGARRRLSPGVPVFIDDTLGTGADARLAVQLGTATKLSLGERTRVKIDKFLVDRGGELVLGRGAMLFDRPDDTPSAPLEVSTPFGLIAARGTKFWAGPSKGTFGVFVAHGSVVVSNRAGSVELTDGLGTDVRSRSVAPTPPHPWAPPRIAAAIASVS
jgi:ferric-dicitrate binding protein FerR (iron transport regulator)